MKIINFEKKMIPLTKYMKDYSKNKKILLTINYCDVNNL